MIDIRPGQYRAALGDISAFYLGVSLQGFSQGDTVPSVETP
jgi:hypothetical protein